MFQGQAMDLFWTHNIRAPTLEEYYRMVENSFCEDLDEGKYSIVLIYALQQKPENLQLANLLSYRKSSGKMTLEQKELVLKILHKSGAIDNTRLVLESLHNHTRDILRELETRFGCSNPEMEMILELLRV
ncbi:hypothetical protein MCOR32_005264 [Pyricularia oryzae]|nr:hypothetical protein MCOR01_009253 [Pyricularia oryzae]KAI6375565.1 hypothetical protein MCOR32_005264 [Pyricularia oryzae]KAI6529516.1 hypothetical protein MCOR16_004973 [Pyricularia oryzae]